MPRKGWSLLLAGAKWTLVVLACIAVFAAMGVGIAFVNGGDIGPRP